MKVKIKSYLLHVQYPWDSKPQYILSSSAMENTDYYSLVNKEPFEIEVEVPDNFDPRPQQIAKLEEQKRLIQAEFAKKVAEIDDQIKKYLAITQ